MSVFGGDSWAREAQYRKRRVDDLVVEGLDGSSYKKLSNGKYACLVCSNNPILDSPLMLSMHNKGSCHLAAVSRLKEREPMKQNEVNKRIALSDSPTVTAKSSSSYNQKFRSAGQPLIEQTAKPASRIVYDKSQQQPENRSDKVEQIMDYIASRTGNSTESNLSHTSVESEKVALPQHLSFRERRERELKFISAGWKRDCHGKWYRDENVEFDSDEEDPNVCLG
ncbi:hypothetical protein L6164_031994 [Bauhinia variegata]|uniref:Uncharacterized protein n=1 Tax=Bauhinia variegata TaxID=167791 RepID=A0ACB9KMC6_BAUVA|nr:hypothetical protein L6164_031994 [Bauhinia variegata]